MTNTGKSKPHLQPSLGPPVLVPAQPCWPRAASQSILWFPPIPDAAPGALSLIHYANWEEPESQTAGQQIFAGGKEGKKEMVWLSLDILPAARNYEKPQSHFALIFELFFSVQVCTHCGPSNISCGFQSYDHLKLCLDENCSFH